ncbi:hypothetical protein GCM10007918_05310 [Piscinibacter gummiphilus]|nr:hypothetical protein GCM10007918_05310 [Piscinibacter gummiphilus]
MSDLRASTWMVYAAKSEMPLVGSSTPRVSSIRRRRTEGDRLRSGAMGKALSVAGACMDRF